MDNVFVFTSTGQAISHYYKGQYLAAIHLLEEIRNMGFEPDYATEQNVLIESYHATGQIIKCYEAAEEMLKVPGLKPSVLERAQFWHNYYAASMQLLNILPPAPKGTYPQAKFMSDMRYDLHDYDPTGNPIWKEYDANGNFIRNIGDLVNKIKEYESSPSNELRIYSIFLQAINLPKQQYAKERVELLMQCIKLQPTKALYWGQLAMELAAKADPKSSNEILYVLQNAIDLDPRNAHWIYEKVHILSLRIQLAKDRNTEIIACLAIIDQLNLALNLTRPDEMMLRQSIIENLEMFKKLIPEDYKKAMNILF